MTKEEIENLKAENEHLKSLVKEGKDIFSFLNESLGLEKAAKSNFFLAKIASIITKVQRNPQLFEGVVAYAEKLKNLEI